MSNGVLTLSVGVYLPTPLQMNNEREQLSPIELQVYDATHSTQQLHYFVVAVIYCNEENAKAIAAKFKSTNPNGRAVWEGPVVL